MHIATLFIIHFLYICPHFSLIIPLLDYYIIKNKYEKRLFWASLMAQWLRIRLPMQGRQVRALAREDPTCRGKTKPMHHNY